MKITKLLSRIVKRLIVSNDIGKYITDKDGVVPSITKTSKEKCNGRKAEKIKSSKGN